MIGLLRNPLVLGGAALLLLVATFGTGLTLSVLEVPPEKSEEVFAVSGKVVGSVTFRGRDPSTFITSWSVNEASEPITVGGRIEAANTVSTVTGTLPSEGYYRVCVKDSGGSGDPCSTGREVRRTPVEVPGLSGRFVNFPADTFTVTGPVNGVMKVELWLRWPIKGWVAMASDGALLVSGSGSIELSDGTTKYQEGDTARFRVETGAGKWRLFVLNDLGIENCGLQGGGFQSLKYVEDDTDGRQTAEWYQKYGQYTSSHGPNGNINVACKSSLTWATDTHREVDAKFVVPKGAFRPGGTNQWKVVLVNEIIKRAEERVFFIDQKDLTPEVPTVTLSPQPAKVGEPVTVTLKARGNPASNSPIRNFVITVWYGSSDILPTSGQDIIVNDHKIAATYTGDGLTYTGTYTFTPTKESHIRVRAYAIDAASRPSGTKINGADAKALEAKGMTNPNTDAHVGVKTQNAPEVNGLQPPSPRGSMTAGAFLVVLVALLAGVLAWFYLPAPPPVKLGAIALAGAGAWWWIFVGVA